MEEVHSEFIRWLFGRADLDVSLYRSQPLARRIPACLRALRVDTAQQACNLIRRQPEKLDQALTALLIGVTAFYRDPVVFTLVRQYVIPALARRDRPLSVWSAGCSNGAELYTMAILLDEAALLGRSSLLGTDCRQDALHEARQGSFNGDLIQCLPSELRSRYFVPQGHRCRLRLESPARIQWQVRDLLSGAEEGSWDVILCRNLAIYLDAAAAGRLWGELARVLRPGGFLVVGKAERPRLDILQPIGRCVYRKRECC